MKILINSQSLILCDNFGRENVVGAALKYQNILRKACLVGFLVMFFFSFSYAQVGEKGDISKYLTSINQDPVNEVDKIPVKIKNEFGANYSNVQNVTWKKEDGYYEVAFTMNNKSLMAFFDFDGELMGEGYFVNYEDLPKKGREHIAKDYPDYKPEKAMYYRNDLDNDNNFLNFFGNFLAEEAYFVLLRQGNKEIVVQVTDNGEVSYFNKVHAK